MTKPEFLDTLRRRLAGLPPEEIDELVDDYAMHFAEGMAEGRSEAEIAKALGDPARLARELRAEAGFRRWEASPTPANFLSVTAGFIALVAVDFMFLLPLLLVLAILAFAAGIVLLALILAGSILVLKLFQLGHGFTVHYFARIFTGVGLVGVGIGGGALLLIGVGALVHLLGRFARLHYSLLGRAEPSAR